MIELGNFRFCCIAIIMLTWQFLVKVLSFYHFVLGNSWNINGKVYAFFFFGVCVFPVPSLWSILPLVLFLLFCFYFYFSFSCSKTLADIFLVNRLWAILPLVLFFFAILLVFLCYVVAPLPILLFHLICDPECKLYVFLLFIELQFETCQHNYSSRKAPMWMMIWIIE